MQFAKLMWYVLIAVVITGCAHPLVISPDISKIEKDNNIQTIPKNVGYYISDDREKEITTPGGGGDKVRYKPYKDIETAFYKMLSNVFKSVTALKSDKDVAIGKNEINYIISLDISTNSSSPSMFTWPPTKFGVNLNCNIKDETGRDITSLLAVGEGSAEFDEFKSDFSLAGKRASQDALLKMQRSLLSTPELTGGFSRIESPKNQNNSPPSKITTSQTTSSQSNENKLKELKQLYDAGLISNEVNLERQKAILSNPE